MFIYQHIKTGIIPLYLKSINVTKAFFLGSLQTIITRNMWMIGQHCRVQRIKIMCVFRATNFVNGHHIF